MKPYHELAKHQGRTVDLSLVVHSRWSLSLVFGVQQHVQVQLLAFGFAFPG